jgi:hypothetical protein
MTTLTRLLEYSNSNNTRKKELLNSNSFTKEIGKEKALLLSTDENNLIRREVVNAISEGADRRASLRYSLPIMSETGRLVRVPYDKSTSSMYADKVSEGANIPDSLDDYSYTDIKTQKFTCRSNITNEILEDSNYGVIELELNRMGAKIENRINREIMTTLLDDHGSSPDDLTPSLSHISLTDIANGISILSNNDWLPTHFIIHPASLMYTLDSYHGISYSTDNLWGLNTFTTSVSVDDECVKKWDPTVGTNNYNGIIMDSFNYACIVSDMKYDVKEFSDPMSDIVGLITKMKFGVGVLNDSAAILIKSK